MIERWQQLAPRERMILGFGALLAVLIVGWGFVWTPLANNTATLTDTVSEKARLLVDLRRAAGLTATSAGPAAVSSRTSSLIVLVDETSRPFNLSQTFPRTSPDGQDAIMVSFRDAPFDSLVAWLVELEETHAVLVETFSSSPTGQPGVVSGQVRLRRS